MSKFLNKFVLMDLSFKFIKVLILFISFNNIFISIDIFITMITKKDFLNRGTLLSEQKTPNDDYVEMISLLLHSRTQTHTLHLQTESYPEHMALNGYYDGIGDIIDGLVESYQGKYGILKGYKSYDVVEYKSTESTIKYLKDLCGKVEKLRSCCKDSYIQNQIDTACELINSTLYKLRFLK